MSRFPRNSPWGEVRHCDVLCNGVFAVNTEDGGGVMVRKNAADFLSPEARKIAFNERNYLCFNKGNDEAVVFRELLDKNLWDIPHWITNKEAFENHIKSTISQNHPKYWEMRQTRLSAETKPQTLTERLETGKQKAAAHNGDNKKSDIPRKNKNATEY